LNPTPSAAPGFRGRLRDRLLGFAHKALPQTCALCAMPCATSLLCAGCAAALPRMGPACPVCALPSTRGEPCGRCLAHLPAYDRTTAAFIYAYPLDQLVQSYKYRGMLACAGWFAGAMLESRAAPPIADAMVAVPLAKSRQRERGFNQALEIAKFLARHTGIPLLAAAVERTHDTPPQASLPWRDRAGNVRGAYACAQPDKISGRRLLVVDDVMTTGASLEELAKTLKRAGAVHLENWLIARTLPPSDPA